MNPNNYKNQKLRGIKRKYEIVMSRGGKCEICGYNTNISALEFHHLNPKEKDFQLDSRHFSNTNLKCLQKELNKCILVCANCHREIHNYDLAMINIPNIIREAEDKKSFSSIRPRNICPICGNKFSSVRGKVYCSKECRNTAKYSTYPSILEVEECYKELQSWEKVANHFGLTRRIIQGIRKRS